MHPMLTIAVKAARRAGNIINQASQNLDLLNVSKKSHSDYVSEVDGAAENAIKNLITVSHHSGRGKRTSGRSQKLNIWIIDLDGTTNFLHGFPKYSVSIALKHKGVLTFAVVYDPPIMNYLLLAVVVELT
jgi:myo-inositol-1(or 4)-monophosphatase